MAEKIVKELKLEKFAVVKCKELELLKGNLDSSTWVVEVNNRFKIAVDVDKYMELLNKLDELMDLKFEYDLETEILKKNPINFEDVRAVVLNVLKDKKDLKEIVEKVKAEHPYLFHKEDDRDIDLLLNEINI